MKNYADLHLLNKVKDIKRGWRMRTLQWVKDKGQLDFGHGNGERIFRGKISKTR